MYFTGKLFDLKNIDFLNDKFHVYYIQTMSSCRFLRISKHYQKVPKTADDSTRVTESGSQK